MTYNSEIYIVDTVTEHRVMRIVSKETFELTLQPCSQLERIWGDGGETAEDRVRSFEYEYRACHRCRDTEKISFTRSRIRQERSNESIGGVDEEGG